VPALSTTRPFVPVGLLTNELLSTGSLKPIQIPMPRERVLAIAPISVSNDGSQCDGFAERVMGMLEKIGFVC